METSGLGAGEISARKKTGTLESRGQSLGYLSGKWRKRWC